MGEMSLDAIEARNVDERIVCQAILGKNLHDVYSNKRIELAIKRESAKRLMQENPEAGVELEMCPPKSFQRNTSGAPHLVNHEIPTATDGFCSTSSSPCSGVASPQAD